MASGFCRLSAVFQAADFLLAKLHTCMKKIKSLNLGLAHL